MPVPDQHGEFDPSCAGHAGLVIPLLPSVQNEVSKYEPVGSLPGILKEKAAELFFNKLTQPVPVSVVYEDHTVDTTGRLVYDKESNWYMIQIYPVELTSRVVKILLQIYR